MQIRGRQPSLDKIMNFTMIGKEIDLAYSRCVLNRFLNGSLEISLWRVKKHVKVANISQECHSLSRRIKCENYSILLGRFFDEIQGRFSKIDGTS